MSSAEQALHRRTGLACEAAVGAGLAGRFRVWDEAGLLAVLVSDPALRFLSTVSGVTREGVPAAIALAGAAIWDGVQPTVVVSAQLDEAEETAFLEAGWVRGNDRGLAIRTLEQDPATSIPADVVDAGEDSAVFRQVLLAGYEVEATVAAFIEAEHRLPTVRRFLAVEERVPIAAAAMTIHGRVAVLGGASTPRAHRGKGGQTRLIQHRLRVAAEAGCTLAVATAHPGSVSATNLRRAGFRVQRRSAWTKP